MFHVKLSRTVETVMGVGIPLVLLGLFEVYYRSRSQVDPGALVLEEHIRKTSRNGHAHQHNHQEAERQNRVGVRVIVLASAFVGLGIFVLGCASGMNYTVMMVGGSIFIASIASLLRVRIGMRQKTAESVKSTV